jgi:hypothetical protein
MKNLLLAVTMLAFAVSAVPQARGDDVSIDFIYDNLSGGNWIDVEGYGYGWQPDVVVRDPNWRPYSDGYWAYTDYGWTWVSYEDFGWATYHYGRWANLADYGWVWFPGEDLDWGPAWVSWRTGGDYIGWAPLPPRGPGVVYEGQPIGVNVDVMFDIGPEYYNFCDVRFIGEPVLRDRIFPPVQNVTYITNTVNVTNITVQNNIVYNYGPDYTVVNRYSSRPIQRLTVERQAATNLTNAVKSGTLTKVQGNKLLVAAPQKLAKAAPTAKPPAVKAKVAQPKIERGWRGVPNKAELEQKIKAENPKNIPPPTRAAAREAGSPPPGPGTSPAVGAERGPVAPPGPRGGRAGRVPPGATQAPSLGQSPAERGRPPARRSGEGPNADQGGAGEIPAQNRDRAPARERFGTPAPRSPMGAAEQGGPPRGPAGLHQQVAPEGGAARQADEARAQRERLQQGAHAQPPERQFQQQQLLQQQQQQRRELQQQQQQQRGGAPASADHGQGHGQPEGGNKRQPKGTPPPRPQ